MSDNDSQYSYEQDDLTNGSQDDISTDRDQPPQSNENTQLAFNSNGQIMSIKRSLNSKEQPNPIGRRLKTRSPKEEPSRST